MILKKLSIKYFGKLKNLDVDLAPGLNIVYGENESGKSTIQSFIKGIFYGLRKKSKKEEIAEYNKYEPWDGSEFAGMIEYEVEGKNYKVARNFATNKVSIYNELWDDVTDEFETDKKNGSLFAQKHIGMTEDTFERTIFIKQLESRINESKDITDRLINIQQTGIEETSYRGAVETLEGIIKEKIGNDKTSKKPINLINNEIERLLKEKYEVNMLRKDVVELEEKIREKQIEREKVLEKIENLKGAKQSIKKENLLELYNKAKEYETRLESTENEITRLQAYESFPFQLQDKLREVLNDIKNFQQIMKGKKEYLEGIEAKLQMKDEQKTIGEDGQFIYAILSDFQIMMDTVKEKDEFQQKLNILHDELDQLESRAKEFGNSDSFTGEDEMQVIEYEKRQVELGNKLKEIEKIKEEIEKFDIQVKVSTTNLNLTANGQGVKEGDFTFENMEQVLIKYRAFTEYKGKISTTQYEIDKIKHDIAINDTILFDQEGFANLPEDIEEQVMKLYDKPNGVTSDTKYELESLKVKEKTLKYQLLKNILLIIISLGFIGYGALELFSSREIIPMVIGGIGLVILIFSAESSIEVLRDIRKLNKEKNEKIMPGPYQKDDTQTFTKLNEIYKSVGAQDFTSFMKNLYSYKDATHKGKLLHLDVELKNQYLESIKDQMSGIQEEISSVLSFFGIMHNSSVITDMDILNLKDKFNKLISTGHIEENTSYNNIENKRERLLTELRIVTGNEDIQVEDAATFYEEIKSNLDYIRVKLSGIYERLNISDGTQLINRVKYGFETKKEVDLKKYEIAQVQDTVYKLIEKVVNIDHKIKMVLAQHSIEFHEESLVDEIQIEEIKEKLTSALKMTGEVSNLKALKENISSDFIETEAELKGALSQKDAILEEAMVHSEDEFFEGCRNRIKVKELLDEKSRLLNILDELLKGEDSQSILQKIITIEHRDVYAGDIESLEDAEIQIEGYKKEIDKLNEDIINLKNDAANRLNGKPELNEIVEQLENLQGRKLELESSKQSIEVAINVLNEIAKQMQQDFAPKLQNEISKVIKQITSGKYSEVKANENLNLNVLDSGVRKIINIENLSIGTIEQFYLALRIALSNVLGEGSEKLPLIIDEAFVQYDDIRMLNILEFLLEASKFRQIIIFTCQSREVEAIKRIGNDEVKIIELSAI